MENWRVAIHRIRGFFGKRSPDTELDVEFRAHIELLTEENIRKGMSHEEARYARGANLLFEVRARDPFLLGSALFVLLAVAFSAAWIPARRAMRVDHMVALRYE
jgi:hypothetical protein